MVSRVKRTNRTAPLKTLLPSLVNRQVVAGMNYKLVMTISDETSCLGAFEVTIYDHFGDLSVTKFGDEMSCDDAKALAEEDESESGEGL